MDISIDEKRTGISPSGYVYGGEPLADIPFWADESGLPSTPYLTGITMETRVGDNKDFIAIVAHYSDNSKRDVGSFNIPTVYVRDAFLDKYTNGNIDTATLSIVNPNRETEIGGSVNMLNEAYTHIGYESTTGETYNIYTQKTNTDNVRTLTTLNIPVGVQSVQITQDDNTGAYDVMTTNISGETVNVGTITPGINSIRLEQTETGYNLYETGSNGTESLIGTIETGGTGGTGGSTDNLIAEVNDAIVEDTTNGYDFHTITETENNGTKNQVGSFYIARNQITDIETIDGTINKNITIKQVNQSGSITSKTLNFKANTAYTESLFTGRMTTNVANYLPAIVNFDIEATYISTSDYTEKYPFSDYNNLYKYLQGRITFKGNINKFMSTTSDIVIPLIPTSFSLGDIPFTTPNGPWYITLKIVDRTVQVDTTNSRIYPIVNQPLYRYGGNTGTQTSSFVYNTSDIDITEEDITLNIAAIPIGG